MPDTRGSGPMTATAVWFSAPRSVELRPADIRPPAPGEVQVRSLCALISAGSEMNLYRGEGNLADLSSTPNAEGQLPFPVKFGYQEVGEVEAVGADTAYMVGDRVYCFHPHQTRFTLRADLAWKIPADLDPERAAFAGLFGVALNACISTPVLVGDCVVVSGLGVIGAFAGYLARLTAGSLVLVEPSPSRRRRSEWIGADAVVHPDEAAAAVEELSDGRGADLFIEASGAPPALQQAMRLTGPEGTVTVASWYGTRPVPLSLSPEFHQRRQKIISTGPSLPAHLAPRWDRTRMRQVAFSHLAHIDASSLLVTHRIPFQRAAEAYALLDDPEADTLGVLLDHR
jgi:2-desacetyl-2-hydroxyethyl bacteriochlorophyllide A dehydrogenase